MLFMTQFEIVKKRVLQYNFFLFKFPLYMFSLGKALASEQKNNEKFK